MALYFAKLLAQKKDPQRTLPAMQLEPGRCRGMLQAQRETSLDSKIPAMLSRDI